MTVRRSVALTVCFAATCMAQRGDFNAREFVERMDRNKNGVLERDEVDGRAEGWLKRAYPEANFDKGVSVRKLADRMQKAHEERMRDRRDRDRDRDRDRRRDDDGGNAPDYDLTALVPGFGEIGEEMLEVPRFGDIPGGVNITKEDRDKAKYVMDRYDRNKNGYLEMNERPRDSWSDDPYKYDLNKDKKISRSELTRRYAMHRVDERDRREKGLPSRYSGRGRGGRDRAEEPKVEVITGGAAAGYVPPEERLPEGLPEWFAKKDKDGDGQLSMSEFLAELTTEEVAKFTGMDADNNGILVASELGVTDNSRSRDKVASRAERSSRSTRSSGSSKVGTSKKAKSSSSQATDEKYQTYASGRIKKYDTNKDGYLSIEECKAGKPGLVDADADKNGKITVDEVARYYQRLYKR